MGMDPDEVDRMVAGGSAARWGADNDNWGEDKAFEIEPYRLSGRVKWLIGIIAAVIVMACVKWAMADDSRVDANILTGLDVSSSISPAEINLQIQGIATAMQSPEILAAIHHGRHHRIGFAVYLWADAQCQAVVDWRIIASAEDAADMTADLGARVQAAVNAAGVLTDVSKAMLCGRDMLVSAPFAADRDVLNIVTNGSDNVGGGAAEARDELLARGISINAVALPGGDELAILEPYLRLNVISPIGFVLVVRKPEGLTDAWRRKFIGDLS